MGIRLFAAKGKVRIQAQNDAMALLVIQGMVVSSSDSEVTITGRKGVTIGDGSRAYIKLSGGRITIGSPAGEIELKDDLIMGDADGGRFTFPSWSNAPVQDFKAPISFEISELALRWQLLHALHNNPLRRHGQPRVDNVVLLRHLVAHPELRPARKSSS
ncbi:hypothetical protein BTHE68_07910 [Burkholderia sp. THE68]|nr:hypothetical protein BTHE68_07910 [Burkholderia sp. THE68]